jgi:BCCT family betaine/carnitine transporter
VSGFVQNWTVFYWAYWLVWCVATPFFIGVISRGRTIKNVILGGYGAGLLGTFTSFIIFGNYGLAQQMKGYLDVTGMMADGTAAPDAIIAIFHTLPFAGGALLLLVLVMVALYSTTFDTLTMVISMYSYKRLETGEVPDKKIRAFWAVMFIIFPIGLLVYEKPLQSLQAVSIIAALPVGVIVILIVISFLKDASLYLTEREGREKSQPVEQ